MKENSYGEDWDTKNTGGKRLGLSQERDEELMKMKKSKKDAISSK